MVQTIVFILLLGMAGPPIFDGLPLDSHPDAGLPDEWQQFDVWTDRRRLLLIRGFGWLCDTWPWERNP